MDFIRLQQNRTRRGYLFIFQFKLFRHENWQNTILDVRKATTMGTRNRSKRNIYTWNLLRIPWSSRLTNSVLGKKYYPEHKWEGFFCIIEHNCSTRFWAINFELIRHMCKLQSCDFNSSRRTCHVFVAGLVWRWVPGQPQQQRQLLASHLSSCPWSSPRLLKSFSLWSPLC